MYARAHSSPIVRYLFTRVVGSPTRARGSPGHNSKVFSRDSDIIVAASPSSRNSSVLVEQVLFSRVKNSGTPVVKILYDAYRNSSIVYSTNLAVGRPAGHCFSGFLRMNSRAAQLLFVEKRTACTT